MKTKTLKITITNMPENLYEDFWKQSAKDCYDDFGFTPEITDNMNLDMNQIALIVGRELFVNIMSDIVAGAFSAHVAQEVDKKLNIESL